MSAAEKAVKSLQVEKTPEGLASGPERGAVLPLLQAGCKLIGVLS